MELVILVFRRLDSINVGIVLNAKSAPPPPGPPLHRRRPHCCCLRAVPPPQPLPLAPPLHLLPLPPPGARTVVRRPYSHHTSPGQISLMRFWLLHMTFIHILSSQGNFITLSASMLSAWYARSRTGHGAPGPKWQGARRRSKDLS